MLGGGGGYILTVDQQSDKAVIDWHSFSVGKDNTVNFNQPSSDSATLNRVTGDFTSEIAGRINSNGSVFLVNPNGILITADGVINTGGFVASTLDVDNNDFLNGDYTFTKSGRNGVVSNRGSISVDDGGFVALLGGAVKNDGTVRALVGKVGFAGGEKIVMSFGNNDFLRVEVPTDTWDKLTDSQGNKVSATLDLGGEVDARGGFIDIAVADASDILRQTISIDGIVSANTVSSTDGVISISGGTVGITGNGRITADADYGNAGTIAIEADTIDSSGIVSAVAQNGTGGTVKVSLQQGANLNASTRFDVSGGSRGGSLSFIGGLGKQGTKVLGSADFKADSTDGKGGYIDISNKGGLVGVLSGTISASGKTQGGRIRLGGAFQGGGYNPKTSSLDKRTQDLFVTRWGDNSSLFSAGKTSLGTGVIVNVSSQSGTGGTAILWADNTTNNYAGIDATGSTGGGAVEISGKKRVDSFGLKRVKTDNGVILLDPKNVVIGKWASLLGQINKIADGVSGTALADDDRFGGSVSLSSDGTKLAVGSHYDDTGASDADSAANSHNAGAVYLYTVAGSPWGSTITKKAKLAHDKYGISLSGKDYFGRGVSLSADGGYLAVGAANAGGQGAVYLYTIDWATLDDSRGVTEKTKLVDGKHGISLNSLDSYGNSVSLSANGKYLAVGANYDDDGASASGAVYLYTIDWATLDDSKGVTEKTKLAHGKHSISLSNSDYFGVSVWLSSDGSKLAVGAPNDDTGKPNSNRGAVYLYTIDWATLDDSNGVTQKTKLAHGKHSISLSDNDKFGGSVSLSTDESKLAVGSTGNSGKKGAVYLYTINWTTLDASNGVTENTKLAHGEHGISLADNAYFGFSVSFREGGTELAVGAIGENSAQGAVYLINVPDSIVNASDLQTKLKANTDFKIVASNDIVINDTITATGNSAGKLTLIAGRSIKINNDVTVDGGLDITANASDALFTANTGEMDKDQRDTGKAEITVATGKTISGGDNDLLIEMLKGASSNDANKKQTGAITVWKAEGKRVSIIHEGTGATPSDSEIVILSGGRITSKSTSLAAKDVGIELVADKFTNKSDKDALKITSGRYLVWTKAPADNDMGGILKSQYFEQYGLTHGKTIKFHVPGAVTNSGSGFIYSTAQNNGGGGSGGGGGGGGGGAAIVLIGAGVAVVAMGGIGGGTAAAAGAGAAGASGGVTPNPAPVGSIDTLFNTGIYAHLNGIDMQALYQPPIHIPSVFNTPQQVTYKAKYATTYDMAILANNIKAQKAVPLYELDEQLYETLRRIFVQQSTPTHKTASTTTTGNSPA